MSQKPVKLDPIFKSPESNIKYDDLQNELDDLPEKQVTVFMNFNIILDSCT